jgi:hypothetical protein
VPAIVIAPQELKSIIVIKCNSTKAALQVCSFTESPHATLRGFLQCS